MSDRPQPRFFQTTVVPFVTVVIAILAFIGLVTVIQVSPSTYLLVGFCLVVMVIVLLWAGHHRGFKDAVQQFDEINNRESSSGTSEH